MIRRQSKGAYTGITIWIYGGIYNRNQTFMLNAQDSGTKHCPIVYRSIPGQTVRIMGAQRLNIHKFQLVSVADPAFQRLLDKAKGHVYKLNLVKSTTAWGKLSKRGMGGWSGTVAHAELFFNHKVMQLARWPDKDAKKTWTYIKQALNDTTFHYAGNRPQRWRKASDIWFHGYWKMMWADVYAQPKKIDLKNKLITLKSKPGYGIKRGQPYYAINLLEEISEPGEWYLDRQRSILYFWPPANFTAATNELFISLLDKPLIKLQGCSWVTLAGLTIEMGRDALVTIADGNHNHIQNCLLRNSGRKGVIIYNGTDNGVEYSEITATGEHAVFLKGGDRRHIKLGKNFVRNCHIHDYARWVWTYSPAVLVYGAGNIVEHNLIENAPHCAILFNGNEHKIQYNHIRNVLRWSSDAGAIYTGRNWGFRNNIVQYNFIHDIKSQFKGYGTHGIYLDDCVSGITVKGNILYRISDYGIEAGGGRDNTIINNIIVKCGTALSADSRGIKRLTNDKFLKLIRAMYYQEEPWKRAYPRLAAMPNDWAILSKPPKPWLYPQGCIFSRNIGFANKKWIHEVNYGGTGTMNKWQEVKHNIKDKDPHFVDEAGGNLMLSADSPAYSIPGFEKIPFNKIGIQPKGK